MSTKTRDEVQVIEPPRPGKRRYYTAQEKLGDLQMIVEEAEVKERSATAGRGPKSGDRCRSPAPAGREQAGHT